MTSKPVCNCGYTDGSHKIECVTVDASMREAFAAVARENKQRDERARTREVEQATRQASLDAKIVRDAMRKIATEINYTGWWSALAENASDADLAKFRRMVK